MKVYVYPADETGCGLHRLIWPAYALQRAGHDVVVINPRDRGASLNARLDANGNMVDVQIPSDANVIVLQRITHRHLITAIRLIREQRGVAVVIDMDDDLARISPNNPAFAALHPTGGYSPDHNWQNTQRACEAATLATVSTDALLPRYAPHGRGVIIRNCIPARYLEVPRVDSAVVGWAGSLHSHPHDMDVVGTAVAQLVGEGARFHNVGPGTGMQAALRLPTEPTFTGPCDPLEEWPREVNKLGVGIAPLADTRFNDGKSWLKPLEYAALGVPCVVSPSPEYRRIHELGVGLVAHKPRQWLRHLRDLVGSSNLRAELSERGRAVASRLTIDGNAHLWWQAWEEAYKLEQSG